MRAAIASTLMATARPLALVAAPRRTEDLILIPVGAAVQCVWCGKDIDPNEAVIEIDGAIMHDRPCRSDFEAHVYGVDACDNSYENRYEYAYNDGYDLWDGDPCNAADDGRVLDYARSADRAIIERMLRIPVGVE